MPAISAYSATFPPSSAADVPPSASVCAEVSMFRCASMRIFKYNKAYPIKHTADADATQLSSWLRRRRVGGVY